MNIISLANPPKDYSTDFNRWHSRQRYLSHLVMCRTFFVLMSLTGCNGSDPTPVSHGGPVRDHVSLVDTLRAQGLMVEPTGLISQPFFPVAGQTLRVNGEDIQVFEFEDSSSAKAQVKEISPDGMSIGNTVVQWVNPPHFFLSGKIIALYLGTDAELLKILEGALGNQISGASP